ncbi:MAG: hypothetical protein NTX03_10690 [Bacteroidetes bacterium]|nr:hypothetical protein [Bacteroidota bacterium]
MLKSKKYLLLLLALYAVFMLGIAVYSVISAKHYVLPWYKVVNYFNSLTFLVVLYYSRMMTQRFYLFFFAGMVFLFGIGASGKLIGLKYAEYYMLVSLVVIAAMYFFRFLVEANKNLLSVLKLLLVLCFCAGLFFKQLHLPHTFFISKSSLIIYWLMILGFCWEMNKNKLSEL